MPSKKSAQPAHPTQDPLTVVWKPVGEIHPYERNPRFNDEAVEKVANSIKQFGWKVPIVVSADGEIVAGHTRYKAAVSMGLDSVPCIVAADLSAAKAKAFRLADNKTGEIATWDWELLDAELAELNDMELDFDMGDFGFDASTFAKMADETQDESGGATEIDPDSLSETVTFKVELTLDDHAVVMAKLREIDDDPARALVKLCQPSPEE